MKLCIFTKYTANGPSSRYRFLQYLPALDEAGYKVTIRPFFDDRYLRSLFSGQKTKPGYLLCRFLLRLKHCLLGKRYDLVWIEGELFPFLPSWMERIVHLFLPTRRYYDYDDAIWLRYSDRLFLKHKFAGILKSAAGITAGNRFLADHLVSQKGPTLILPTVVRWEKYAPVLAPLSGTTIGWIGTPKTVFFLLDLLPAFETLAKSHRFTLRVIGATITSDSLDVDCQPWSQEHETKLLSEIDIGVMPLRDDAWSRGKCGLKLIQYLATGVPAVASPVGVNTELVTASEGGFLAQSQDEWVDSLSKLLTSPETRKAMGAKARAWIKATMTVHNQAPRLIHFLQSGGQISSAAEPPKPDTDHP